MPDSTTGDIIWTRTDPKTITLTNRPSETPPVQQMPAPAEAQTLGKDDQDMFVEAMRASAEKHAAENQRHLERMWRKQLRTLHRSLKDPNTDQAQGMQELFDSGAARLQDGNLYTSVPMNPRHHDAMLEAVRQWQQVTGEDNSEAVNAQGQTQGQERDAGGISAETVAKLMGMMAQMGAQNQ